MRRTIIRFAAVFLAAALCSGCGSRPGVEEDFTSRPEPNAPVREPTDEELAQIAEKTRADRLQAVEEIREEEKRLYIESDEEIDVRGGTQPFRFSPGDKFSVRFVHQPEMNMEQVVRPDGKVSFDLIGDLPVAGTTPEELSQTLVEMYAVYLRDPIVNIVARTFLSQRYFVVGEVNHPGEFVLLNPTSLSQAIAAAGSWTTDARTEDVMVIRAREDGTPFAFRVNLKEVMRGAVQADPYLHDMDVVYVPMGKIASARNFVRGFFNVVLPPIDTAWKAAIVTNYLR